MKIVMFGLSISSAWGNGHATLLRGLFKALHKLGHEIHFFERDTPFYSAHRDLTSFPFAHIHFYSDWSAILADASAELRSADVGFVTSYCPDGAAACEILLESNAARKIFYDMDTPVTLARLEQGERVPYIPKEGLGGFDLVLSYTGGQALRLLRDRLHARRAEPLYGWVDPESYFKASVVPAYDSDLSYLGTYSIDRQAKLEALLLRPAELLAERSFVVGGAMYPILQSWPPNVRHFAHIAPPEHAAFYSSSPLTLNITRGSMAAMGYCPSGRLFEAAACGTAVLSDWWTGLDAFFEPGEEILIANSTACAADALSRSRSELNRIGARARERALDCHTAALRARRLVDLIESSLSNDEVESTACLVPG